MKAHSIVVHNDEHWHELRRTHVGGSDIGAALSVSPWKTRYQLWAEKRGLIPPPDLSANERVWWGSTAEPIIAQGVAHRTGWPVRKVKNYLSARPELALGGTLDYEIVSPERGVGVLECKNVDYAEWRKWGDEPPLTYQLQLQSYLHLTQYDWGVLGVLCGGNKLHLYEYERRPDIGELIEYGVGEFWRMVDNNEPPDIDYARDAAVVNALYTSATEGKTIDLSDNDRASELAALYNAASAAEAEAKSLKDAAKAELLILIGDAKVADLPGFRISASAVAGTPDKVITEADVGSVINGRTPYRKLQIREKEAR